MLAHLRFVEFEHLHIMRWSFDIISDLNRGFELCREIFNCIDTPYVFSHPALLHAWWNTYIPLRDMKPIFITGHSEDDNKCVFPLVLWKRNWKNAFQQVLVPIGYSDFDYHDPLLRHNLKENDKVLFWSELSEFIYKNVYFDKLILDGISDNLSLRCDSWTINEICPLLRLDGIDSEEDLMKFFKTSLRGDIRRQIRRLSETGELQLVEYPDFESIPPATFRLFMQQHSLRWPNAYKAPNFHENLLKYGLKEKCVHFSVLKAGENEVAWHLGFQHKGRYYYYMPAGHQDYLKFSPAKIHLFFLVKRAVENGFDIFDHLRGEENYKDGWSNDSQHVNTYSLNSNSTISVLKRNLLKLRDSLYPPPLIQPWLSIFYALHHDHKQSA